MNWTLATTAFFDRRVRKFLTKHPEALAAANQICEYSLPVVMAAKESVNRAYESTLSEGILFERRVFHSLFATEDQKEGMAAFVEKRKAKFKHK